MDFVVTHKNDTPMSYNTPLGSTNSIANSISANSFTHDLVTNCFYALSGATCLMILSLIYFISYTTGTKSLVSSKNLLLFGVLWAEFGVQIACAFDVSAGAGLETSVFRFTMVALFQTLFLWYQWTRCHTLIETELSPFVIRVIKGVLLFVTPILWLQPVLRFVSVFGQRAAMGASALLVFALDIVFGVICRKGLIKRAEQVQEIKGDKARGVAYTKIIARYGFQASVYLGLSFLAQTGNIVLLQVFRRAATPVDGTMYGIFLVVANCFVFMTVVALLLMKIKLAAAYEAPSVKVVRVSAATGGNTNQVAQINIHSSRVSALEVSRLGVGNNAISTQISTSIVDRSVFDRSVIGSLRE
ncbi:hypothetical protein BDR26DRAFT_893101 [Obelidium mucronatum]|nr:hypothetical protein BDR26DRAFT_893101 [Obelidium mucronatum]